MGIAEWCGRPVIDGEWRELAGEETRAMAAEIRSASLDRRGDLVREDGIERVRVTPLACYPGAMLVEAQARVGDSIGLSNHLQGPWGLITLDGSSAVIHDINEEGWLTLDTEEQARAYLALFCNTVRGDGGRFHIITDPNELLWYAAPEDAIFAAITIGVRARETEEGWEIEAPVRYDSTMFVALFQITRCGIIEMIDDQPVAQDMPIAAEGWRGQYRLPPGRGNA